MTDSDDDVDIEEEEGAGADMQMEDDSIHAFTGHAPDPVYAVAWSPVAADLVATGGGDDRGFIWRVGEDAFVENEGAFHALTGHTDTVCSLEFNADGSLLATGGMDGRVKIWNSATGACVQTLEGPGEALEWVRWHPRGNVLLAGSADFTAWMWMANTGAFMNVFTGHAGSVTCGGFTPDGKLVVTGGGEGDASLRIWDPKNGECKHTVQGHPFHAAGINAVAFHRDSAVVVTVSEDSTGKIVNLEAGRVVGTMRGHDEETSVEAAEFMPNLQVVGTGGLDGKLIFWDLATTAVRATCQHDEGITQMACHPTQPLAFTGCLDGMVRCWDARTGSCVKSFYGNTDVVQDLALSPDGNMVLCGCEDGTARVFSMLQN